MEWVPVFAAVIAFAALAFAFKLKRKVDKANRRIRSLTVRVEAMEKYSGIAQTNTDIRLKS